MGNLFGRKRYRILMLGLDNAGKTSIVQRLHRGEIGSTIPTVGFLVQVVTVDKIQLTIWDIGGQNKIRPLWRHYFAGTQGLIFVVDSNDHERIDETAREFEKIVNTREMRHIRVLIFCNKQDLHGCLSPEEIQKAFKLDKFPRPYLVMPCSARDGTGLIEGLRWLSKNCR